MIYLAVPYMHDHAAVRKLRMDAVTFVAAELTSLGFHVFSPITHSHPLAESHTLPLGFDYWEELDRKYLSLCDRLVVLTLDGWDQSKGVTKEIEIMEEQNKPVSYLSFSEVI